MHPLKGTKKGKVMSQRNLGIGRPLMLEETRCVRCGLPIGNDSTGVCRPDSDLGASGVMPTAKPCVDRRAQT
jgi:hypothetical protein